jgi:signal transduction histidine kinase
MNATPIEPLPLHAILEALEAGRPPAERRRALRAGLGRLLDAYGVAGAELLIEAPPLERLALAVGSLRHQTSPARDGELTERRLTVPSDGRALGVVRLDAEPEAAELAARALELVVGAAWARAESAAAARRLEALDAAVRGIAGVLSVERVLQLIVDRVRELVGAQYAALGIVGPFGAIEQFITSGISRDGRAAIGAPPRGHGLLGLIIREDRALRIDDLAHDPRRYGFPAHHPQMHSFLGVPVRSKGQSIGNLYLTNKATEPVFSDEDERLVEMFALHAGIAIENARLHEEVQRLAVVEERHRISQDLHDNIIQSLYAVTLSLDDLPELLTSESGEAGARLDRNIDALHQIMRDIRNFILGLRPELLDEADLASSLGSLAEEFRLNTLIDLEVQIEEPLPELPATAAGHLLAMVREGLSNIARHSSATRASLELRRETDALRLVIGDNGKGFETGVARSAGQHGLANLLSRAEALGGSLTIHSEPAAGTRLTARIPLEEDE